MREPEGYRAEMEQIRTMFPGKGILNRTEAMQYTGRGRVWLDSHGFQGRKDIPVTEMAEFMARLRRA